MKRTETNVDMSRQNELSYKLGEFIDSIKLNGMRPTLDKIKQRIYYKILGVDFSTQNIYDLTLTGEHKKNGTALVSTSKDYFQLVLSELERVAGRKIKKSIFLDYGSGKGGAIVQAKKAGFIQTIGIEFAKELHEKAEQNIKKLHLTDVTSYYKDATTYFPPLDISVIYFFNPFDEVVMEKVAQNITSLKHKFYNDVYIIYGTPTCSVLDKYFTLLEHVDYPTGAKVRYYKV